MVNLDLDLQNQCFFVQFSVFAHRLPREQVSGMHVQNELKMTSKMIPEGRRIRGRESMSKWMEDGTRISGIWRGLESTSEAPVGGEKEMAYS